ncbi:hypothetical protein CASFOL_028201 [Castilleja foliolosa]|uniref:GTD-binding domain-containing protein n=1 Tax=Castilleja foliolosa TaxID=1961234 RepID=A0ABD3CFN4_9LAMI
MERKMACQTVQTWDFIGLVAAFLDLAIAYLLLCASAVAYVASQFLGFFGLSLPCPCDGMFLNTNGKTLCLNKLLVDFPIHKVSDIHLSVKHRFPFGDPKRCCDYDFSVDSFVNKETLEIEGEGLCSSVTSVDSVGKKKCELKGKGVISTDRSRSRLRHRKYSSVSSCDVFGGGHYGHSSSKGENRFIEASSVHGDTDEARFLEFDNKDPPKTGVRKLSITGFETNHSPNANAQKKKIHIEEAQSLSDNEKYARRNLEQMLEEERIARAALYIELEKERSAAASAADEAMAMILRLQEEKASIEMEARQYQRILEEKSTYDAEEMNILKEILVRREKERLFLEKEVEEYRLMDEKLPDQIEDEKIIVTCDTKLDKESIDVHVIEPTGLLEHRGRENIQLKLLEDIARQVQEIRRLSGYVKNLQQASLPLPTSKVFFRKKGGVEAFLRDSVEARKV